MHDAGTALMGIGTASGETRAVDAAKAAISSPLLEESVEGATGILLNITGGHDLGLFEVNEAAEIVAAAADKDSNIIFGAVIDDSMGDDVRVTVIATGFDHRGASTHERPRGDAPHAPRPRRDDRRPPALVARDLRRRHRHPVVPAGQVEPGRAGGSCRSGRAHTRPYGGRPSVLRATRPIGRRGPRWPGPLLGSGARGCRRRTLRRTPLFSAHEAAGAQLVPFAGWEMPVQYAGIREEHLAVRNGVGVFDVSHMGEIETRGPGALEFLQRMLSNDVSEIAVGGAQYSVLCREDGGVLDDLFTYRLGEDRYLTVTNASNHEKDLAWFRARPTGSTSS